MIKKEYLLILLLAFLAGLLGGGLSIQFFFTKFALAQADGPKASKVNIIDAQMFRVKDLNGNVRATFGYTPPLDKDLIAKNPLYPIFGLDREGLGLILADEKSRPLAALSLTDDGSPQLLLSGKPGEKVVSNDYIQLTTSEPTIFKFVKKGTHRIVLGVDNEWAPHVFFLDKDEKPVWKAP